MSLLRRNGWGQVGEYARPDPDPYVVSALEARLRPVRGGLGSLRRVRREAANICR